MTPPNSPCPGCNGTGQMTWFGGVSRFQFSYTDCPECNGVGFFIPSDETPIQLSDSIATSSLSKEQTHTFITALARILSDTLLRGETIQLRGFGSFSCSPSTPEHPKKIIFTPSKKFLYSLNIP